MTQVAATEFARNLGRYREEAQREPVAVVTHNRGHRCADHAHRLYQFFQRFSGEKEARASSRLDKAQRL